ncbi:S8 family serine peptidase [Micromonospora zhanjiangensis]|uniref:S8 family serine peptidase n=1 Tax=Micromonospora zhanjiangensis TaxID=1522057 RepID=A0ABV8KL48_9ACTN
MSHLKVTEAHRISKGGGSTVAVIDTGVDPHSDLQGRLLPGTETFPNGTGDGRRDIDGHGTAMAGLVSGIAPEAKILPVRYTEKKQTSDPSSLSKAVEWATVRKVRVINLSLGGGLGPNDLSAIRAALAADIVIVAAAGNRPQDYGVTYPAALDGVVATGATDQSGERAAISVSGKQIVIVAPGANICSTDIGGKYRTSSGTSDSTAIVSGAVALIRSKYPNLSAKEVVHRLTATATDKGSPGRDPEYGYGELNLIAALTADVPPLEPSASVSASINPSPPTSAITAPPEKRSNNTTLTLVMIAVAALLVVGLVVAVLLPRLRRRPDAR